MARPKNLRIGETSTANNGMKMTIIEYRKSNDIDIRFEDGLIRTNVAYRDFKKGTIRHAKMSQRLTANSQTRIGQTNTNNYGEKMTIVAYRTARDLDVKFENGTTVEHKSYDNFLKGQIKNTNMHVGEKAIMNCGMEATIVAYRGAHAIDIRFADGTLLCNRSYSAFTNKSITNPNINQYEHRIGETNISNNGMKMTIIRYAKSDDIDVKFEDGTVVNTSYEQFTDGSVKNPNWAVGESKTADNGLSMKITAYHDYDNIDIEFETGFTRSTSRRKFNEGCVGHKFPYDFSNNIILYKIAYVYGTETNLEYICKNCHHHDIGTLEEIRQHKCEGDYHD